MPRLGAKNKEKRATKERPITIHGPVGMEGATKLNRDPLKAEKAAIKAEINIMGFNESVQERAAAEGVINKAAIKTTPTAWIPTATAKTMSELSTKFKAPKGSPTDWAKSGLKLIRLNSLKKPLTLTVQPRHRRLTWGVTQQWACRPH